jgi:hypothetical protein
MQKKLPGHRYRHRLVEAILKSNLPIDIYGSGCKQYSFKHYNDKRIKGSFPQKIEALHGSIPYVDYAFTIAIENSVSENYFSEKIINPLLYGTTPLYVGCRNIEKYLPNFSIPITGIVANDIAILQNIVKNPALYRKQIDVSDVLNRCNIYSHLDELFDDITKKKVA